MKKILSCILILAMAVTGRTSLACPAISGIPDFNCDEQLVVTVLGDSLVYGTGDAKNNGKGGYVLRAQRKLKNITVNNGGVPGQNTRQLLGDLVDVFNKDRDPELKANLISSDIVVLDLGRNDRWFFGLPAATVRNLKRIASLINKQVNKSEGASPLVVKAVLMLPNRGSQGPWVKELNTLILKGSSGRDPADLRFDLVSKRLLGGDQIHPTSAGYDKLAKTFVRYLTKALPPRMRKLRVDADNDGIYDLFEPLRFGTSATLADSDGDGKSDGEEVFTLRTDPLAID